MLRRGLSPVLSVQLFLLTSLLTAACTSPRSNDARPLTMPKELAERSPFEVSAFHGCYDGDTCTISLSDLPALFGDHITVRLAGIDTPEIKGICEKERTLAVQAQALTQKLMVQATRIELLEPKRDKYFRILAKVTVDGREVAKYLIAEGLAVSYTGKGAKKDWCEGS